MVSKYTKKLEIFEGDSTNYMIYLVKKKSKKSKDENFIKTTQKLKLFVLEKYIVKTKVCKN